MASNNKESKNAKARSAQPESRNMSPEEFDISKFYLDPITEKKVAKDAKPEKQFTAFPKYLYPVPKGSKGTEQGQKCIIITGNILMDKGGIPTIDGEYRKTEDDCMYFHIPLREGCEDAMTLSTKFLEPLDAQLTKKIDEESGRGFITFAKDKERTLDNLSYSPCITECDPEAGAGRPTDPQKVYRRVKVKLATLFKENRDENEPQQITTKVFTCDENGDPNPEPENVNTLEDLRKLLVWKSTAKFAIEVTRFWAAKSLETKGKTKLRKCGITLKCLQMCITQKPTTVNVPTALSSAVFGSKKTDAKREPDDDTKSNDKSDDDSDGSDVKTTNPPEKNKHDSDSDTPPQKTDKKKVQQSDSDSDTPPKKKGHKSDSDSDSDKQTSKKGKDAKDKKGKKKESSDDGASSDDDSDTKKPKKPNKKPGTKTK